MILSVTGPPGMILALLEWLVVTLRELFEPWPVVSDDSIVDLPIIIYLGCFGR